jgi:pimeloyl-ACP methyl ester carboxylesterase
VRRTLLHLCLIVMPSLVYNDANIVLPPYSEHHLHATTTIVLIHGGMSCGHDDWKDAIPYLTDFHLLVPDLPGHGSSRQPDADPSISTFSLDAATVTLSLLIRKKAKSGRAHIVAFSIGAHVAMHLVPRQPELILDVLLTGFNLFPSVNARFLASLFWFQHWCQATVSRVTSSRTATTPSTRPPDTSFAAWHSIAATLCNDKWPLPWPARTLIVAVGRPGFPQFGDSPDVSLRLCSIGRQANPQTAAYGSVGLTHAWPVFNPELFAAAVCEWLQQGTVPDFLDRLDR